MDSSKALISALLAEGLGSYKQAIAAGLTPDRLVGEGRSTLSWVIEYVKETSQLPTPELVLQMTGIALGPSEAPSSFLIKHVNNNHLLARLQEMTIAAQAIQNDLEKRGAATNGADTLALIQATVSKIQTEFVGSLGVGKLTDFDDMLAFYDRLKAGERGIPSPWPTLNESTLGFWPEDLVLIAARMSTGKSWCAIHLAHHAWKTPDPQSGQRRKVLIITTEMAQIRLKMRFAAIKLRIPYNEFTHGRLDAFQEQRLRDEAVKLKDAEGLHIVGGGFDFRMESVEAAIDACGADMVVLDGVYLIKSPGVSRPDQMANTFNEMKRLAKRKRIVMAITTQFNREVKKEQAGTVQAESIALSDVGSWNSDLIFGLIQTTEMKAAKELIIKPLKVREGAGTDVLCRWDFDTMDFSEKMTDGGGGGDADEKGTPLDPLTPISSGGATFEEDEGLPF